MTLPASEPRTTTGRFAPIAKSATISSGAFPKLALRKPPMPGPVCSAACSVASPISHASGMREIAASTKSVTSPAPVSWSTAIVTGARTSDAQRSFRPTAASLRAAPWA